MGGEEGVSERAGGGMGWDGKGLLARPETAVSASERSWVVSESEPMSESRVSAESITKLSGPAGAVERL